MKKILTTLFSIFFIFSLNAQDVADKIAEDACECIDAVDQESGSKKDMETMMGLCLISAAQPYNDQLKKQYGIDMSKDLNSKKGKKLGEIIGVRMLGYCPGYVMAMGGRKSYAEAKQEYRNRKSTTEEVEEAAEAVEEEEVVELMSLSGSIVEVSSDDFVSIMVKQGDGRQVKLYWMEYFEGAEALENIDALKGKEVVFEYEEREFFEPQIKQYIKYKVIKSVEFK